MIILELINYFTKLFSKIVLWIKTTSKAVGLR